MDRGRPSWWWLLSTVIALVAPVSVAGCAHTEGEWQAKVRELEDARKEVGAEHAQRDKAQAGLDGTAGQLERIKQQLRARGVDPEALDAGLEQLARATEEQRRRAEQIEALKRRFELLRDKLERLDADGLAVTVRNNRVVIQLPGDLLFDEGRETLRKEGRALLLEVARVIRADPGLAARSFQVAGHTDGGRPGPFKDGWGLSLMRAREVLTFLVQPDGKGGGLNASRWSAAGYGDADPLKSNDSPDGKRQNRRCEIVVVPSVEELLDLRDLGPRDPGR